MTPARAALGLALGGLLLFAGSSAAAAPAVSVVSHGPRTASRVALTFDDGVDPANCRRILATLVGRGVPATFFPIADAMRADPAFWRMVVAEGDPIGVHTLTHPQLPTLTEAAQFHQIDGARREAESISGAPVLRVFRPPYGAYNAATLAAASQAGFPTVLLWDTSDRDTSLHGTVAEMLAAAELARNGSVVLMHCGPNATPFLLGSLIDHLEAAGLQPVTVPELLGLRWTPAPVASPPTPDEILAGEPPLPEAPKGGVVVGPVGIGTMTFPPAPTSAAAAGGAPSWAPSAPASVPVAAPSASPIAATPEAKAAAASPSPSSAVEAAVAASPSVTGTLDGGALASGPATDGLLLVGALAALVAAAVLAVGLARARR